MKSLYSFANMQYDQLFTGISYVSNVTTPTDVATVVTDRLVWYSMSTRTEHQAPQLAALTH